MKRKLTKAGAYGLCFLFSILLFPITCWGALFQYATPYWIESIGYFLLTYICIEEFTRRLPEINSWLIGSAVILGQLVFQAPIRISDFMGSIGSVMIVVSCLIATVLAVFCCRDKRPYTFILSYVVLSLFNSFVAEAWNNYVTGLL